MQIYFFYCTIYRAFVRAFLSTVSNAVSLPISDFNVSLVNKVAEGLNRLMILQGICMKKFRALIIFAFVSVAVYALFNRGKEELQIFLYTL